MRTLVGVVLLLAGAGIILYGLGNALFRLVSLYQGALNDPLNQPPNAEADASAKMIHYVIIGAVGVLPMLIGSILLKISMFQKLHRAAAARSRKQ